MAIALGIGVGLASGASSGGDTTGGGTARTQTLFVADLTGIYSLPTGGAAVETLRSASITSRPVSLDADADGNVYSMGLCASNVVTGDCPRASELASAIRAKGVIGGAELSGTGAIDAAGNYFFASLNGWLFEMPADGSPVVAIGRGMSQPRSMAIDPAGNIFVADELSASSARVDVFPASGGPLQVRATGLGTVGSTAVDSAGNVLVAQPFSNSIAVIFPNGTRTSRGQGLNSPWGVAVDRSDNVYVADTGNNRVVELPVTGGPPQTLAINVTEPRAVIVQPTASAPPAPPSVTATAGNASATVSWSAPKTNGGSPVAGYVVTPFRQGVAQPPVQLQGTATSTVFGDLVPGLPWTFKVAATNAVGTGLPSRASTAVTPRVAVTIYVGSRGDDHLVTVAPNGAANGTLGSGLSRPGGIVTDGAGNTFVADTGNDRVIELPRGGGAPVVVGVGLSRPQGVAVDPAGNVYVADTANSRVVVVPAGGGPQRPAGTGLAYPSAVAVDGAGNVFVTDTGHDRVVKISAKPGEGQVALGTGLRTPTGLALDAAGNAYVADTGNNRVVRIASAGGAQTAIGTGFDQPQGVAVDTSGNVYVADTGHNRVVSVAATGSAVATILANVAGPRGIAAQAPATVPAAPTDVTGIASDHQVLVAWKAPASDGGSPVTGWVVTPTTGGVAGAPIAVDGTLPQTTVTGLTNGAPYTFTVAAKNAVGAGAPSLPSPAIAPAAHAAGDVFFTKESVAQGAWLAKWPANGGAPTDLASLGRALPGAGVAADASGNVYAADETNNRIVQLRADGSETTIGGNVFHPEGVAVDASGDVFVLRNRDAYNGQLVGGTQELAVIPGDGSPERVVLRGDGDDAYHVAGIVGRPLTSFTVSASGDLYLGVGTGSDSAAVVKVSATGAESVVSTGFKYISDLAVDGAGNVFVADYGLNAIVKVAAGGGPTSTIASGTLHRTGSTASGSIFHMNWSLSQPSGIAVDSSGTVWFAAGQTLWKVPPGQAPIDVSDSLSPIPQVLDAAVQPAPTAPSAPLLATARITGAGQLTVDWQPPKLDGGTPVTGYTISAFTSSGAVQATFPSSGTATSKVVTGLPTSGILTFRVAAQNSVGTGPMSVTTGPSNMAIGTPVGPQLTVPVIGWGQSSPCTSATYTVPSGVYWVRVEATGSAGGAAPDIAYDTWLGVLQTSIVILGAPGGVGVSIGTIGSVVKNALSATSFIVKNQVGPSSGNGGGQGAIVDGQLRVTPGQTLYVTVGQPGIETPFQGTDAAGFNGGGLGRGGAGGGGGTTMVSTVPPVAGSSATGTRRCYVPSDKLLVAAGGGGGAGRGELFGNGSHGGNAGVLSYNADGSFTSFGNGEDGHGPGGGGGTATNGGGTGSFDSLFSLMSNDREPGDYLAGGPNTDGDGGGGGGGYYGGGPGAAGYNYLGGAGGGGGGSSYLSPAGMLIGSSLAGYTGPMATVTPMSGSLSTPSVDGISDPCVARGTCGADYPANTQNLAVYNTVNGAGIGLIVAPGTFPNGAGYATYWYGVDNEACGPSNTAACSGSFTGTSPFTLPAGALRAALNATGVHTVYVFGQTTTGFRPVEPVQKLSFYAAPTPPGSTNTPAVPVVTTQPRDTGTALAGAATFIAAATGNPVPSVQWQQSTDNGTTWTILTGATTARYAFSATATSPGLYRAVFTNASGAATTSAARLFLQTLPAITLQPESRRVVVGDSVTFSAEANPSTTDPVLPSSVQWQQSTDGVTWSDIAAATAATYTFSPTLDQNGTQFRAVFTDAAGSTPTAPAALVAQAAPVVTLHPNDQLLPVGTTATFTADAVGNPPPAVQWQTAPDSGPWVDVAGATAPALSVPVTADSPGQRYRAVFTNAGGSATTDEARIALAVAPAVATHPTSQTVALGDSVSFTATAHGVPDPTEQWERSTDAGVTWTAIAGAAGATYTFTPAAGDDGRRYRARFTNDAGTATSNAATLTIIAQPQVVLQPEDISIDNNTGGSLGAFATGLPAPQQRWQISTDGGATFTDVPGATGPALAVSGSRTLDGARYRAVFTNTSGTVTTRAATLNVRWVQVTRQLACPRVRPGQRVTLTAEAAGNPAPNVRWSASVPGQGGSVEIVGATSTTYSFTATAADANRAFSATFTNPAASSPAVGAGQDFTSCSLPVVLPRAPYGLGGSSGDLNWESFIRPGGPATVSRSVSASGNPAPDAVWQVSDDGGLTWAPIPLRLAVGVATTSSEDSFGSGSTSTTLTWTPTHAEDGLRYRVLFANTAGASASAPTTLVSSPVAPEITRLTPGDASMTVEWNAPFSGGKPITKYTVVALPKTGGASIVSQDFAATATSATLAGLANGLVYDFLVKATTAAGTSPDSARKAAIVGTAPGVARIRMTPSKPSIAPGGLVTFTVTTLDALGNPIADVTAASTLRINALIDSHGVFHPGTTGSCTGNVCTAQNFDLYSVSATYGSLNASADLTVEHPPTLLGGDSGVKSWSGLSTVTLHETAVGDSAPTAAWQVSTDGGATWNAVTAGGTSSSAGATTDSNLTLSPVPNDNGNRYRAVFTTGGGIVTAPVVTLATVPGKPVVTGIVQADDSVTVSWAAPDSGGTPIVRYRVSGGSGIAVEAAGSATSATLVGLPVGTPTRITVVAENAAGAGPASDAVGASARAATGVGILDVAPALATIVAGGSRAFTAADGTADATGDALFSIAPLDRGSANGASCTASSCTASVPGTYVITATHAGVSGTATLAVTPAPTAELALSAASSTIEAGTSQAFTATAVDAYGNGTAGFDDSGAATADATATTTFTIAPGGSGSADGASCTRNACTATTAGRYRITATGAGATGTATLDVVPAAPVTLSLAPGSASIPARTRKAITATATDAYGNSTGDITASTTFTIAPAPYAYATGASCDAGACTAAVPGSYVVTGTAGRATGTATLTVTPAIAPATLALSPIASTIAAGATQAFVATGLDAAGNGMGDVTALTGFTISPTTLGSTNGAWCGASGCTATAAGTYLVTATKDGATGTATLTVTSGAGAALTIGPTPVTTTPGAAKSFTVTAVDVLGNTTDVTAPSTFTIARDGDASVTGASCAANACTATRVGKYLVTATAGALTTVARLSVDPGPATALGVTPAGARMAAGGSRNFGAFGVDAYGNDVRLDANGNNTTAPGYQFPTVTITPVDGGSPTGASCDINALCTARIAGRYRITALAAPGGLTGSTTLDVVAAPPVSLALTPESASVRAGATQTFSANGVDAYGNATGDVAGVSSFTIAPLVAGDSAGATCTGSACTASRAGTYLITGKKAGAAAVATLEVVGSGNTAPTATDAQVAVDEDGSARVALTGADADGDELTFRVVSGPSHGTYAGGVYTPDANYNGADEIRFVANDGTSDSEIGVVAIAVRPVNDPPVVHDAELTTNEDTPVAFEPTATDVDGDTMSFSATQPAHGTFANGRYAPAPNFNGTDSFRVTASDGNGGSATANVTVHVTPVNDAPLADDAHATLDEDGSVPVTLTGTDVDGDVLTFAVVSGPAHGTYTGGVYTPALDFHGADSFTFTAADGHGGVGTGTVTIDVAAVNDPPVVADADATTAEDTPVAVALTATDVDGDTLTLAAVAPAHGTFANGVYTPASNFNGTDTFRFTATDGHGGSATGTATVHVTPVNDPPVADAANVSVAEDGSLAIPLTGSDVDGDALTFRVLSGPSHGTYVDGVYRPAPDFNGRDEIRFVANDGAADSASAVVAIAVTPVNDPPVVRDVALTTDEEVPVAFVPSGADVDADALSFRTTQPTHGTFANGVYTPARDYNGTDSFTFTADDGNGGTATATVSVVVRPVNDPPVATDVAVNLAEDTSAPVALGGTDVDGDPLTVTAGAPAHGLFDHGVYTPAHDFNGTDSFAFVVSDGHGGEATGRATLHVSPVNDAPIALPDAYSLDEDTTLVADPGMLANDTDVDGDVLRAALVDAPQHGTLTLLSTGGFAYTPDRDYNGPDHFTYTAGDGSLASEPVEVALTVRPVNDPPVCRAVPLGTDEDTSVSLPFTCTDVEGDPLSYVYGQPAHGTVSPGLTYTPAPDFNGSDSFDVTVSDGAATTVAPFVVTVASVNDAPVARDDAATVAEDTQLRVELSHLLANDTDVDGDPLTITEVSAAHGTASLVGGGLVFDPAPNYNGPADVTYTVADGHGGTGTGVLRVDVTPVNDPPLCTDVHIATDEDTPVDGTVSCEDVDGDPLKLTFGAPEHGSVAGTFRYTPAPNFHGADAFTVSASDGREAATATVFVTVASVNDPPVAVADSAATDEDTRLAIPLEHLLTNDSDVDGDTLTVSEVSDAEHGTVAIVGGAAVFDPAPNYNGRASFAYRVVDGAGGSAIARVSIEVRPVNDAPTCAPVTFSIDEDTTGSAAPDCVDVDGDTLTYTVGSPFVLEDGRLVARPGHDENGVVTATYRASDGAGGTATAPVTLTVRPVNDVPVATDSSVSLDEDAPPVPIDLGALVSDAETADAGLTYQIVSGPTKGTLSGAGPIVRYDSNDNANGADSFTYRVVDRGDPDGCSAAASARCDAPAASEVRTVRIAIAPVNDPPTVRLVGGAPIDEGGAGIDLSAAGADVDGDTLTYVWTTDVGTVSATGANATLTADDGPATATVRVSVSDGNGGAATVTKTIEIRNVAPTANAGADQTVAWGMPVTFSGTANDVSKADRAAGLSPRWWFGDGASATGATAQHAYAAPGPYTATFAGTDKDGGAASDTADVTVTKRTTTLAFAGAVSSTYGETVLAAKLRDSVDGATAQLAGRSITFTIGGATYTASTDATGLATVAPAPLVLGGPLSVSFAGDGLYTAAAAAVTLTVDVPFAGGGAFVVEGATPLGAAVTFWGSKWAKANGLDAASSFKGFVPSPAPRACGTTWTAASGNSGDPLATLPKYMAVLVASTVTKQGSTTAGDVVRIVIVKVDAGAAASASADGTGVVVATLCP